MTQSTIAGWLTFSGDETWNIILVKILFIAFMFWLVIKLVDVYRKVAAERILRVMDYFLLGRKLKVFSSILSSVFNSIYLIVMLYGLIYLVNAVFGISMETFVSNIGNFVLAVCLALILCGYQVRMEIRQRRETSK